METFMASKFILEIKKLSSCSIDIQSLESWYNKFVKLLFAEKRLIFNMESYRDNLVYTKFELIALKKLSEKKYSSLSLQSYCNH